MSMVTELSVDDFLNKITKDVSCQLTIDPEERRYRLCIWTQYQIAPDQFQTPDLLDLSEADFRVLTAGLQDIMERGAYAEPKLDAAPGGSRKEATEREHLERWRRNGEDEDGPSLLRDARALGAPCGDNYCQEEGQ